MKKKKNILNISTKLKFKKPRKSISYIPVNSFTFKQTVLQFATYGIQAGEAGFMTRGQIESARVALRRPIKRSNAGQLWVLIKPTTITTKRALETRMGRGKGAINNQIALIHKGQLLFEINGPTITKMKSIYSKARQKFSVKTDLIILNK